MSAQHTPGPWHVEEDVREGRRFANGAELVGYIIMSSDGQIVGEEGLLADKAGDARLIAASPDMLAALIAAEIALTAGNTLDERAKARNMVRAALNKAEGRS